MKAIGIILAGGNSSRLKELCQARAISAMPVGSSYRAIDFTLSNMSNSGINKVAIITQYNARSLNDHLSSAKWWNLGRKHGGLFVFTPFLSKDGNLWFKGTADSIYQNIDFLKRSNEEYVIIASGDAIYKTDYRDFLKAHEQSGADITLICKDIKGTSQDPRNFGVVDMDEDMRLHDLEEKPIDPQSTLVSLGIYIMKRELLISLLEEVSLEGRRDFVKDIIIRYRRKLVIKCHMYDGYWNTLNSVQAYMDVNMDFLKKDIRDMFINKRPYIETKPKDEPPAKYNISAQVSDALVGSGSIISGIVSHSVLFRNVYVEENAVVRNSVIMEGSYIGKNCVIENAILDKDVVISDGRIVFGTPEKPTIIAKGTKI